MWQKNVKECKMNMLRILALSCLIIVGGGGALEATGRLASGISGAPDTINVIMDLFGKKAATINIESIESPDSGVTSLKVVGIIDIEHGEAGIKCVHYRVKCEISRANYVMIVDLSPKKKITFYYLNDLTKVIKQTEH